jgi:hypothetical protein
MTLSKRTLAVVWGLGVAIFFTGGWFLVTHLGERGKPMLMPGQSESVVVFAEIKTCLVIFFGTGVPTALLVYWRPRKRGV